METHLQFVQVDPDVVYMQVTTMQDTTALNGNTQQVDLCFCAVACGGGCSTVPRGHGYFGCYGCCMSCYRCEHPPNNVDFGIASYTGFPQRSAALWR